MAVRATLTGALATVLALVGLAAAETLAPQVLREEIAIARILERLAGEPAPEIVVVRDVRVVDPVDGIVLDHQSVVIGHGAIYWTGPVAEEIDVPGAVVIDGRGLYAAPGLTDMHVHTESASDWLLDLACGVTTVREMGGFPWLLAAREQINADYMLGPTLYVAGTIINALPLEGYAVTPRDAVSARRVVRQQAACGYDFVKVHNLVPRRLFDAIAAEAARFGMDVVGHVPHGITVRHAVEQGLRTMEHLKGFIDDRTLQMGDQDYAAAADPEVWVTPTLSAFRRLAVQEQSILVSPAARYVPARVRARWEQLLTVPEDDALRLQRGAVGLAGQIIPALQAQSAQFLAGTDGANYPFQITGFGLYEELRLLQAAGLTPGEALRAATSSPAAAMRAAFDFGRIRPGMRADLVLMPRNPLLEPAAYADHEGVMVRGRWLARQTLDVALAELAMIYADESPAAAIDGAAATLLAAEVHELMADGFVFNSRILREAAAALERLGHREAAADLARLGAAPADGPCAAVVR
ncbi:MAG: amidohydrolase family protein [bacterium]|nr:amidohydrolase family protein [bacterium]